MDRAPDIRKFWIIPGRPSARSTFQRQCMEYSWSQEEKLHDQLAEVREYSWGERLSLLNFQKLSNELNIYRPRPNSRSLGTHCNFSLQLVRKRRRNCSVGKNLQSILNLTILGKGENPFSSFFVLASVYIQVYLFPVPNWNRKEVDETKSKYRITRHSDQSVWQSATIYHQEIAEGREDVVSKANIKHETCGNVIMMTMRWFH